MLLLHSDWAKYPTAIVDTTTKNRSFVRMASVYKKMGIKNHTFLLALINPELQGLDPFDEDNLSITQKAAIAFECKINPWYFFREIARAPVQGSFNGGVVEANRGNIALWWSFLNHIFIILIQPRQTGKSMSTDVLMECLLNCVCQQTTINLLTKDDKLRGENVARIRKMMNLLPSYIYLKTRGDSENTEEITVKMLGNKYLTHVPRSAERDAHNMGRGLTTPIIHIDEPPFQKNIGIAMRAALPGLGAAADSAEINGTPYGVIMTTTAGRKDDKDGRYIYEMLCESAVWSERFLDAENHEQLVKMVEKSSPGGVARINATFSHRQLGKTDAWMEKKLKEAMQKGEDADRDYFNVWTSGSESSPFTTQITQMVREGQIDVLHNHISLDNYITRWYIEEDEIASRMATGKYIMGMDTSEASGGDFLSMVLIDIETMEVVACGSYNETNLVSFAMWVCEILIMYPNIIANIERRSIGAYLIDHLLLLLPQHGQDPFRRLFNRIVNDYVEHEDKYHEIRQTPMHRRDDNFYTRYKSFFGFATSGSGLTSRTELYSTTLQNGVKRGGRVIRDNMLINQMLGLVVRNGRIDHASGSHDDLVIGWLLAVWMIMQGKNLSYYGIDSKKVFSRIDDGSVYTPADIMRMSEQQEYRNRTEALHEKLSKEADDFMSMKIEQELRMLSKLIILEDGEVYSVDQLIREVAEQKRKNRSDRKRNTVYNYNGSSGNVVHGNTIQYSNSVAQFGNRW